ncbi:hypothetical protein ASF70_18870 [Rhizobium sp. Leaf321]|uniref:hypothetical protein n=1 Tax=Rhizobium sp. Leaf321 TaxID=1736335 RepID=UPI0007136DBC|nr:hypothetical protein [Rhizobium sp. Leaf321]KQQ70910.1 hypothetical protein ASF70_18870 [Rhizobium sp. Leaf321]
MANTDMKFRPPYRMLTVYERLKANPELSDCKIWMEELDNDREDGYFPHLNFDTARVFVSLNDFSINVVGRLTDGVFDYQVSVYDANGPADPQHWALMTHIDEMISIITDRIADRRRGSQG